MMRGIPIVMIALLGQFGPAPCALPESEIAIPQVGKAEPQRSAEVNLVVGAGWIAGHVFGVIDDREVPLRGALVVLIHGDRVIREVRTNEEGGYVMHEVAAGGYGMVARAEGFLPEDARVKVIEGHETRQNFLLRHGDRGTGAIAGHVFGVIDDREVPLRGALVVLIHGDRVIREVRTNEEGGYVMHEVAAGGYGMVARAEGFLPEDARVQVIAGHETRQDFLLRHGDRGTGAIAGHVFGVIDDREVPLRGALVVLRHGDRVIREVRTNEEGGYVMHEVAAGEYGMVARAEGFLPEDARVQVTAGHETRQDFLLRHGDRGTGAIVGRVMEPSDRGERPLGGALVTLHAGLHVIRQAVTNDDGLFEMPEVPPGVFALMAQAQGHHPGVQRVVVPPGEMVRAGFLLRPIRDP